ncbi:MAG: prepilin-type N-terminal cleavage/methylation domain-containing protein [Candidatus Electrothrix sp. EH2]|nr:prepilin-type N-terminal cleavage/methylation domain-containing protein [Candidatus Electrothrix sp. EH2]
MNRNVMKVQQDGFTLIETIIAMAIFTIGILGLFGMQTAAIKKNLAGNNITTGSTWASSKVEELIALNYDNEKISEPKIVYKDCTDFTLPKWWFGTDVTKEEEEKTEGKISGQADYFVYWAVSRNCTLVKDADGKGLDDTSPYRPKHLYIAVTRDNGSGDEELTAEFSYIKQNPNY